MKILYVANHGQANSNDDEGAITHALREHGHEVVTLREGAWGVQMYVSTSEVCDLVLFHKWDDLDALRQIKCKKVFWYFDLVRSGDPTLARRDETRAAWMRRVLPEVDLGFCTDGDWVRGSAVMSDEIGLNAQKLVWLTQGADGRIVGRGKRGGRPTPILFTGIGKGGGTEREGWVAQMKSTWREDFIHIRSGLHRESLRDTIASSTFYACPDSPGSNFYWSNRVYNAAGFGATILHPAASGMFHQYTSGEVLYYHSRGYLHDLIRVMADKPKLREELSEAALARTARDHLYRNRVHYLLEVVRRNASARSHPGPDVLERSP